MIESPGDVQAADTIAAEANVEYDWDNPYNEGYTVIGWSWVPDEGSDPYTSVSSCSVLLDCEQPLYRAGTIEFTVEDENGYYYAGVHVNVAHEWNCGGSGANAKDTIMAQYYQRSPQLYDSTRFGSDTGQGSDPMAQRSGVHWAPSCGDFVQGVNSAEFFAWSELKDTTASYAVIMQPLTVDTSAHWGLPYWRAEYGSARTIINGYRTPRHNLNVGGALGSAHMRGVAADLQNVSRSQAEYDAMDSAAVHAQASFVEPWSGPCGNGCTHADWRWWVSWPR